MRLLPCLILGQGRGGGASAHGMYLFRCFLPFFAFMSRHKQVCGDVWPALYTDGVGGENDQMRGGLILTVSLPVGSCASAHPPNYEA